MRQKILVPLDGTEFAEAILEDVVDLAAGGRADVVLLRVGTLPQQIMIENGRLIYLDEQLGWLEDEITAYLNMVERRLRARGLSIEFAMRYGDPASEILRYAEENECTMIAMASHRRTGLEALWHGSVARHIYDKATVPVLLKKWSEDKIAVLRAA